MSYKRKRGFTLTELMIVAGMVIAFTVVVSFPLVNSIRTVDRETAKLNMDQAANHALNLVTANLRSAILPVTIVDDNGKAVSIRDELIVDDIQLYAKDAILNPLSLVRFMNNSEVGFGKQGGKWLSVLERGSDFVPFAVPVPFTYSDGESSVSSLDSSLLPQLGIYTDNGGQPNSAVNYHVNSVLTQAKTESVQRLLWDSTSVSSLSIADVLPIHPYLKELNPEYFGLNPADLPSVLDMTNTRYADILEMPRGADEAFGIIRFVPLRNERGEAYTLTEKKGFDLNEDGNLADSYVLGRLEISYFPSIRPDSSLAAQKVVASSNTVLLQLNTDSPSYKPLFQLRRQTNGGYVVDINMVMCDGLTQQSKTLAFNKTVPFIVRKYTSSVELRNMVAN